MLSPVGLRTHIAANMTRSAILLTGFPVLLLLLAYVGALLFVGAGGAALSDTAVQALNSGSEPTMVLMGEAARLMPRIVPFALAGAGLWYGIAYLGHQAMIDAATGARALSRRDAPDLYNLVENLCISRGVKTPAIRIIDSPALNAYASGLKDGQYSITFTRGLLERLDREEVEAVAAHELTHILNRDVFLMVVAVIFVGIISFVGEMVFRSLRFASFGGSSNRRDRNSGGGGAVIIIALAIAAIAYGLAIVIRFTLSRKREYLADAGAVELTKNPDAMIRALERISGNSDLPIPEEMQAMCIDNHTVGFMEMFATHPPIEKRIAALRQYAGGRAGLPSGEPFWGRGPLDAAVPGDSPWSEPMMGHDTASPWD
jgi:heat shock protein HtpX